MRTSSFCLGALLLLTACRTEGPSVTISADEAEAGAEPAGGDAALSDDEPAPADARPEPSRALWFADGPGRDAILARERRDYETAAALLDTALEGSLSDDERGGAQWLRGLEDIRQEAYASGAKRFAEAAKAPGLAPLVPRLAGLEAQAWLDAAQPERALERLQTIDAAARKNSGLEERFAVLEADTLLRTKARAKARSAYEAYLADYPKGTHRVGVSAKLARMLAAEDDLAAKRAAVELYETLLEEAPLSDYGVEAEGALPGLRAAAGVRRTASETKAFERNVAFAKMDAMLSRRRYTQAARAADSMLRGNVDTATKCRALYIKGSSIFKRRKRKDARPVFEKAAAACRSAKGLTIYEVKSRYQGARGFYAAGQYSRAAEAFIALAKDHPSNSYADDAWVLAGESWATKGDDEKAREAYTSAFEVGGDKQDEALRRLLVAAFARKDAKGALTLCDGALEKNIAHPAAHAKLHYFRGRALAMLAQPEEAGRAYLAAVETDPLGYPSAQAMSRLHALGEADFARGLAALSRNTPKAQDATPGAGAERALLLARLGLGEDAREELRTASIGGWPAIAVLNQAGLYAEGQRTLANLGTAWRRIPPGPENVPTWKLAHPLPFAQLIEDYEVQHGVPDLLAYAVMQTESRFNPGATSWAGARGLIQLMPATAKGVAAKAGVELGKDSLYDPAVNLDLGMRYLAGLVARYGGGPGAVALAVPSYNAGAGAVDRWLGERGTWDLDLFIESIPFDETRHYTQSVVGRWWAYRWIYGQGDAAQRVPLLPVATPSRASG